MDYLLLEYRPCWLFVSRPSSKFKNLCCFFFPSKKIFFFFFCRDIPSTGCFPSYSSNDLCEILWGAFPLLPIRFLHRSVRWLIGRGHSSYIFKRLLLLFFFRCQSIFDPSRIVWIFAVMGREKNLRTFVGMVLEDELREIGLPVWKSFDEEQRFGFFLRFPLIFDFLL